MPDEGMQKLSCWLIVAVLVLHMSVYSMDHRDDVMEFETLDVADVVQAGGRDSHELSGGQGGSGSDCNFTNMADGQGGPAWEGTATYSMNDVVEWPVGSGHYWQTTTGGQTSEPGTDTKWVGPCTCVEIAEGSGITWDATASYSSWQILEHNGAIWMALDAGTSAGDVPSEDTGIWALCEASCASVVNMSTPVWENSTLVTEGEVYEYPAQSGHYYTVVGVGMSAQTVGAPGVDLDAWGEPLDCDCKEIWADSGEPAWDASVEYLQNAVVEWPAGSENLYISFDHGTGIEPGGAQSSTLWRLCVGEEPSGILCDDFNGTGGKDWTNSTIVNEGDIFQYPAGSGNFYIVSTGISAQLVGAPGVDLDAWSEKYCTCEEIWEAGGQPVWDANSTYSSGTIVLHPANSNTFWMAVMPSTTAGVEPGQPWADGNEWELCSVEDNASSGPCGGLDYVGAWYDTARVSTGEIYEFPDGSENFYEVVIQGYLDQEVLSPTVDLDVWAPVECPCEEVWMNAGQPVWDATTTYYEDDVVEWPSGSNQLWIAMDNWFTTVEPSATDPSWESCSGSDNPASTPCAGLNITGVWDSSINVTSGEIYEYPAGSENFYQVNPGSPFWSVSAPDIDADVWSPIECPCKETWVANGEPVWDASTMYSVNDVVEWPATSGVLWIALDNWFAGSEPTLSALDWEHCDDSAMPYSSPCAGLDVIGVWNSALNVSSGEIYEYPSGSQEYYQVNPGSPFWNVGEPGVDMDVWSSIDCPCKETWVALGQPVWVAGTAYPGDYVVEHPVGSGHLYTPLEPTGVSTGAGEPGVDMHWVLCEGQDADADGVLDECEEWAYWNPDLIDSSLPGDGCPMYVEETTEDDDESDGLPSIGVLSTVLSVLVASAFVRGKREPDA